MDKQFFNKKATFDYEIIEAFEAGLVLTGSEIKAIRANKVILNGSYVKILGGEVYWVGGNINVLDGDPDRSRKLLLHRTEIERLVGKVQEKGLAMIPLKLYLKKGKAKLEVGLGRGLKKYDKREVAKKKDHLREMEQTT